MKSQRIYWVKIPFTWIKIKISWRVYIFCRKYNIIRTGSGVISPKFKADPYSRKQLKKFATHLGIKSKWHWTKHNIRMAITNSVETYGGRSYE